VIPLDDARRRVLDAVRPLEAVRAPLLESLGLALAAPVTAPHDVPPFANSAMDGYAVRAEDVGSVPVELTVLEDVAAGRVAASPVRPGTAIRIMTGAPLPSGADTVVRVEDTERVDGGVRILAATPLGTAVRLAGGDIAAGGVVFAAGTRLTPAHLGVLSSLGVAAPLVHRRPRVGLMSTGDEVKPPETPALRPGWIRDANRPLLTGLLAELGVDVHDYGIVPDDERRLASSIHRAAAECDVVITSGGVSMGDYDLVKRVLTGLGGIELWKVAMQPAKPFAFGAVDGVPLFGLPGNPVSVMVAFEQFARPALLTMMGSGAVFRPRVSGRLTHPVATDPAKVVFLRVLTRWADDGWEVTSSGGQASNVLSAVAAGDAFAVVPVGVADLDAFARVDLEMFRWPETRTRLEVLGAPG
jgi:molybdenum cofactor synthesis domain-containing protein